MTLETEDLLQSILDSLDRIDYIRPDDIPDIELYMDQVTTFMDNRLKNAARNPEVDKILTKTMINNYAKSLRKSSFCPAWRYLDSWQTQADVR